MTAEIAILNRSALALAADSAVTITVGRRSKVYDTAEKLFELSKRQPIALMIYNNVEYVGVPLDVLIRRFRASHDDCENYAQFKTIREAADKFLQYLCEFQHEVSEEESYLYLSLSPKFKGIFDEASTEIRDKLFAGMQGGVMPSVTPSAIMIDHLNKAVDAAKGRTLKGFLRGVTMAAFNARYGDVVTKLCAEVFRGITLKPEVLKAANRLAYYLAKSRDPSDMLTGLVFGGFAESDMFPTLHYLEIDGIYFGQVKVTSRAEVDIDRRTTRAEIVPFAQKEMVERFMYGLDSDLEKDIRTFVDNAIKETLSADANIDNRTRSSTERKVSTTFNKMISELKETSRQDLLDIVYFMSKKELGDIAYALVELTSQKRRFSTAAQSVGGPIDVAILTKSEGLVWIERKHYFGPEKNPTFYSRVFGAFGGSK